VRKACVAELLLCKRSDRLRLLSFLVAIIIATMPCSTLLATLRIGIWSKELDFPLPLLLVDRGLKDRVTRRAKSRRAIDLELLHFDAVHIGRLKRLLELVLVLGRF